MWAMCDAWGREVTQVMCVMHVKEFDPRCSSGILSSDVVLFHIEYALTRFLTAMNTSAQDRGGGTEDAQPQLPCSLADLSAMIKGQQQEQAVKHIQAGADHTWVDEQTWTLLHTAAYYNAELVAKSLCEAGADAHAVNRCVHTREGGHGAHPHMAAVLHSGGGDAAALGFREVGMGEGGGTWEHPGTSTCIREVPLRTKILTAHD